MPTQMELRNNRIDVLKETLNKLKDKDLVASYKKLVA